MRPLRALRRAALVTVVLATGTVTAQAQAQSPDPTRKPAKTLISLNPLGLPFEYFSAEIENKLTSLATLGTSASYLNADDVTYLSVEAKLRFYPNEEIFKGFSLGLGAGFTRVTEDYSDGPSDKATRPTIMVMADYNWLLGKSQRVVVGTGVGAKRIFGSDDGFVDVNFAYPTVRFQVGVTF